MDTESLNNAARSLPFDNIVGGPLVACVKAQKQVAQATLDYFKAAGFEPKGEDDYEATSISFTFVDGGVKRKLTVPLITILPIPYIQIDTVNIKFRADMSIDENDNLMAKYSALGSVENNYTKTSKYNVQNQIDVEVVASGHSVPEGLSKLLEILTNTVKIEDVKK